MDESRLSFEVYVFNALIFQCGEAIFLITHKIYAHTLIHSQAHTHAHRYILSHTLTYTHTIATQTHNSDRQRHNVIKTISRFIAVHFIAVGKVIYFITLNLIFSGYSYMSRHFIY